jgi:MFS family permease
MVPAVGGRYRWAILSAATVMQVGLSMPQQTPAAIGPVLVHSLGLTHAELGLLTSAIWGGMLLGMLPFGLLVDRLGERAVVGAGSVALATFLLLASRTGSFLPLFLLLIPAAIGASSGSPGGTRAIAAWFPATMRGSALGIRQAGVTVAGVLAAVLLPPIALRWGWPAAFATVAGAALASVLVFALAYREPVNRKGNVRVPLDLPGLLRNRGFLAATLFGWMFMGVLGSFVTYLPASLHEQAGIGIIQAGLFLALLQVGGLVGRIGWGIASDRAGSRSLLMGVAGVLAGLSAFLMALLGHPGVPAVVTGALCFVLGLAGMGWNGLYIALAAESVPLQHAATAVGAGATITFTGMFAITPLFGLLADRSGGYVLPWLALGAWALAGAAFVLAVPDRRRLRAPA